MDPLDSAQHQQMHAIDSQLAHVWMVRTFLKHSDEAAEDEELASVHRELYDFMLALGPAFNEGDFRTYLRLARKKFRKLQASATLLTEIQPEISGHTNFRMAVRSLQLAVTNIERILQPTMGGGDDPVESELP